MEYGLPEGTTHLKLTKTNYPAWAECTKSYMQARGYWNVVDGSYPKPSTETKDGKTIKPHDSDVQKWRMADRRAWCDITALCRHEDSWTGKKETAKELWERLERTKKPRASAK